MGKLYTSRYANKDLANSNAIKVSISRGRPKFPLRYEIEAGLILLAPSSKIFGITDNEKFARRYMEQLDGLGFPKVLEMLKNVGYGSDRDVVLLCFEDITCDNPKKNFCHRTVLAEWLRMHGIDSEEYPDSGCFANKPKKEKKPVRKPDDDILEGQMALF